MQQPLRRSLCALTLLCSLMSGCAFQAPYMRRWDVVEGIPNRWSGGSLVPTRLSPDEAAVYADLGTPEAIRFFRTNDSRQQVYEWVYLERAQSVWFVDRQRVDYVTVDTNTSGLTKETRETLENKAVTGGILGGAIGSLAAGMVLFGKSIGLRE